MDENSKNEAAGPSRVSTNDEGTATDQRENHNSRPNKLLPFSIEAILSAPHPKRDSRRATMKQNLCESVTQEEPTTALTTLEEFTSVTLKDAGIERTRKQKNSTLTLEQKLVALQARLNQRKRRKPRTCFTNRQIIELEKRFMFQKYLSPSDRDELSLMLGLSGAQIITWFQNRRAKFRRDVEELKSDVKASSIMSKDEVNKMCETLEI